MMEMEGHVRASFEKSLRDHVARERAWWSGDRRGRWVVLEPGPGRRLDAPPHVRDYVDAFTERRGRRFSSLSRARAFAREIGGEVRHWRRRMGRRIGDRTFEVTWRYETNPWARAARHAPSGIFARDWASP